MALIVQKFGGSSVADANKIRNVARIITETYKKGNQVVAVLSAQGDTTDDLIEKAAEINPNASKREMDMLLSTGEQISCSLCAMAIEAMGFPVISLTGWQAGFRTDSGYGNGGKSGTKCHVAGRRRICAGRGVPHGTGSAAAASAYRQRRSRRFAGSMETDNHDRSGGDTSQYP